MYWAYYDTSGAQSDTSESTIVVMCLVSTAEKWREFEKQWDAALNEFDVPHFHMKEYAHFRGPFEEWREDPQRRAALVERLIHIIKNGVDKGLYHSMLLADFEHTNKRYRLAESYARGTRDAGAYALLNLATKGEVDAWVCERSIAGVHHFFERGDAGQRALQAFMDGSFAFVPKVDSRTGRRVRPFEAADFLAYEFRKVLDRNKPAEFRRSLYEIFKHLPIQGWIMDREMMERMCRENPSFFPPRTDSM